jgi:hypothetical protein
MFIYSVFGHIKEYSGDYDTLQREDKNNENLVPYLTRHVTDELHYPG